MRRSAFLQTLAVAPLLSAVTHPEIVRDMTGNRNCDENFPDNILQDWETTKRLKVTPPPAGDLPHSID